MEFIRENLLKIVVFIVLLVIGIVIFTFIFGGKKVANIKDYGSMEQTMVDAAKRYISKNQKLLPKEDETTKINLDTLVNFDYISSLSAVEDENTKCNGYVEVINKNDDYQYIPYLRCGKYYETQSIADYILNNSEVVTVDDGLYHLGNKYVYRGENPRNYLGIGNRLYRIMDISEDGTVRLISYEIIRERFIWDDRYNSERNRNFGINDYSKSRIKDSLNNLLITPEDEEDIVFSDAELQKMVPHDICIGKRPSTMGDISDNNECQKVEPNQKVSLITVSDYARISLDPACKSIFDKNCMNYNYLNTEYTTSFRTLTATTDNTYQVFYIDEGKADLINASSPFRTNIVIYIDSTSLYKSGDGSYQNPYTIR